MLFGDLHMKASHGVQTHAGADPGRRTVSGKRQWQ
jgi:hypothetical protein